MKSLRNWAIVLLIISNWVLAIDIVHLKTERIKMEIDYQVVEHRAVEYYNRWVSVVEAKYDVKMEEYEAYDQQRQIAANSEAQAALDSANP